MSTLQEIDQDINKLKKRCYDIYNEYKDNKLFQLLWDSRDTLLTYQFDKAGIIFGDNFIPDFLEGFSLLYKCHIEGSGGIRYNQEEIEKYGSLSLKEKVETESPSFFTKHERNNYKEFLNGNGDSEDKIYKTCIKYIKEDFFYMINFETMKFKFNHINDNEKKYMFEKYGYIIEKYLT